MHDKTETLRVFIEAYMFSVCLHPVNIFRYLVVPNLVSAAVSHGCTMIHPGYGFLSENATFVDICRDHGLNFIGPNVCGLFMVTTRIVLPDC